MTLVVVAVFSDHMTKILSIFVSFSFDSTMSTAVSVYVQIIQQIARTYYCRVYVEYWA